MEIRMNFDAFLKLKNFVNVNDIKAEIVEYDINNDQLLGKLSVRGKYLKSDMEKEYHFDEDIPFNIMFNENYEVEDIDCINFDYQIVEGRGLDLFFEILVVFNEEEVIPVPVEVIEELETATTEDENILDEELDLRTSDEVSLEELKEDETEKVNKKLDESFNIVTEKYPTEEKVISENLGSDYKTIRVCYYHNDEDLEELCNSNNVSIEQVFKENRKNEFNKYRRIIINERTNKK